MNLCARQKQTYNELMVAGGKVGEKGQMNVYFKHIKISLYFTYFVKF